MIQQSKTPLIPLNKCNASFFVLVDEGDRVGSNCQMGETEVSRFSTHISGKDFATQLIDNGNLLIVLQCLVEKFSVCRVWVNAHFLICKELVESNRRAVGLYQT